MIVEEYIEIAGLFITRLKLTEELRIWVLENILIACLFMDYLPRVTFNCV